MISSIVDEMDEMLEHRIKGRVVYDLFQTAEYGEQSIAKGIPIGALAYVREYLRSIGRPVRFRYRGPRAHRGARSINTQSYCLKQDATTFAIYHRR